MKLIVITYPTLFEGEIAEVCALFEHGLEVLHLRKPEVSYQALAAWLSMIPEAYHERIVLHDHPSLKLRYPKLRGVHLNSRTRQELQWQEKPVSCSCHSLNEVREGKTTCKYVFLSPIFDSISKQGYASAFNGDCLEAARQAGVIDAKVYALGGISLERIAEARAWGFGGVVVLGDLWQYRHDSKRLLAHFDALLAAADSVTPKVVLSIAGSDCSGGAGIQADIKTISALGGYAASVITAVTVQNTLGVHGVYPVPPEVVVQQLDDVMSDLPVAAIKVGMLCDAGVAHAVAHYLKQRRGVHGRCPMVYDPVMKSTSGHALMSDATLSVIQKEMFPQCALITPNLNEAEALLGHSLRTVDEMEQAAVALEQRYGCAVLVKGGHLEGSEMCDVLSVEGTVYRYALPKIESKNLHGTGCTLSSAIATRIAQGDTLSEAVAVAKNYMNRAIAASSNWHIGSGNGPLGHFG